MKERIQVTNLEVPEEPDLCSGCDLPLDEFGCCDNPDCPMYDYGEEDEEEVDFGDDTSSEEV